MVCRYAPDAPDRVTEEAVIRGTAWLLSSLPTLGLGGLEGPATAEVQALPSSHANWFTLSGARSLVAPWRVRRAGAI